MIGTCYVLDQFSLPTPDFSASQLDAVGHKYHPSDFQAPFWTGSVPRSGSVPRWGHFADVMAPKLYKMKVRKC